MRKLSNYHGNILQLTGTAQKTRFVGKHVHTMIKNVFFGTEMITDHLRVKGDLTGKVKIQGKVIQYTRKDGSIDYTIKLK